MSLKLFANRVRASVQGSLLAAAVALVAVAGGVQAQTTSMAEPTWRVVLESEEESLDLNSPVRGLHTARFGQNRLLVIERPDLLPFPDNRFRTVGYLVTQSGQPPVQGQFGRFDGEDFSGYVEPIAQGPDGRLVALVDGGNGGVVGYSQGQWTWGYRFPARHGGWLDSGLWVLASDRSILALDASTRRPDWKVNVHEFLSGPMRWRVQRLVVSGTSGVFAHLVAEQFVGGESPQQLMAINGETGELRWVRPLTPNQSTFLCLSPADGPVRVYRPLRFIDGDRLEVQVLDPATGGVLASTSLSIPEDAPCSATGAAFRDYVTLPNGAQSETLALDTNGSIVVDWRVNAGGDLLPGPFADTIIVATPRSGSNLVIVDRRRRADGGLVWSRTIENIQVDEQFLMSNQDRIRVVGWANDALRVVDLDLETGAILPTEQPRFRGFTRVPTSALTAGESVYTLEGQSSGGIRGLSLARRAAANGEVLASNWVDPEVAAASFLTPSLHRAASRIVARVLFNGTPTGSCAANTTLLVAFDPVGLNEVWRRRILTTTDAQSHFAVLGDGRMAFASRILDPSNCTATPSLQLLSPVDGGTLLDVPVATTALFATPSRAVVFGPGDGGQPRFAAYSTSTAPDWVQSDAPAWVQSINPGIVADGFLYAEGPSSSLARLRRVRGADGQQAWAAQLGTSSDPIASPLGAIAEPGDALVIGGARQLGSGRVPLAVILDGSSGQQRYEFRPPAGPALPLWWSLNPVRTDRSDEFWFVSDRSDFTRNFVPRVTDTTLSLRRLRTADWDWSGDHMLHRQQGEIQPPRSGLTPLGRMADGSLVASHGVLLGRRAAAREVLRFPPPSDLSTDLRIRPLAEAMPLRGLGPGREVRVEIENAGPVAAMGARVRMIRPVEGAAIMTLQSCAAVVGTANCAAGAVGSEDGFVVSLEAGAILALTFEAFAVEWGGTGSSGAEALLAVDTPYPLGEADISNNQLPISLNLGGFANGFEP
jgi:outer membrane protein assembly factor BamB